MNLYKKSKITNVYGILIGLSTVLIILSYFGVFHVIPIFEIFTTTINKNVSDIKINSNSFFSKLDQNEKLSRENIDLRKKNIELQSQIGRIDQLQKDIDSLNNYNKVTTVKKTSILSHSINTIFSNKAPVKIEIDKGEKDGLKVGQIVVNETGSLIGLLDSVSQYTSVIKPYYLFDDIKLPIKSKSTQTALIQGISDGQVTGINLDQNAVINPGDDFYTSGLGDKMPEGIYIGKISKLDPNDKRTFFIDADILNTNILYIFL